MLRTIWFFGFVVLLNGALAQDCVPEPVRDVMLAVNYTLSWSPSSNCDNTDYIIYVHGEFNLDHIYQIPSTSLDVSFLPACESYRFRIVAHRANTISEETSIDAVIPVPPEEDLNVTSFSASQNGTFVLLQWEVDEKYEQCVYYYRVVVVDRLILPVVRDYYLDTNSLLVEHLSPCVEYEFSVRAIYNLEVEGPIAVTNYETPPAPSEQPTLRDIQLGNTYVNLTWGLPYYITQRCPINSLVVDGSPYYTNIFPVEDDMLRPQPTTTLSPLRSDTMYFFRVYVVNNAGRSDPFQIAVQTLA